MEYKKVNWYGKEVMIEVDKSVMGAIKQGCMLVEVDCKRSMKKKGEGKVYYKKRKGKSKGYIEHHASAPGKPPAVDTGRLRASITSNWTGSGMERAKIETPVPETKSDDGVGQPKEKLHGVVGTNVEYAKDLETGKESRNLKPRPYLRPALERQRGKILELYKNRLNKGKV